MRILHILTYFCVLLLCAAPGYSQSLSLFDLDTSAYPLMKGKFYAFDAAGKQASPSTAELALTDDGVPQAILSLTCPPANPPRALSSVLVIDVSGSMALGMGSVANIELAKAAARAWVNALPLGQSECAISTFDHLNYLNHDFTINRGSLLNAISTLTPAGGTNYDQGLLLPFAGGLEVARPGKHQKIIIFLTDGQPQYPPSVTEIIAEARRQNCIIFAVTLGMRCPQSLKDISDQTGGNWFEMVTTVEQAESIYRQILYQAQSDSPCEITWQSPSCAVGRRAVELQWSGAVGKGSYTVPQQAATGLRFSPSTLFIRPKSVGVAKDTTISVTAVNAAFNVTGITSSNPAYQLIPTSFTLAAGQSRNVTVRYTAPDSGFSWTEFTIQTDLCPQTYFASGGYPGKGPKTPTLKLDHPNGGEVFVVGSDTVITWSGLPGTDSVRLEYSTDAGGTWRTVSPSTTGRTFAWHIPKTPSDRCLARVRRLKVGGEPDPTGLVWTFYGHGLWVREAAWSPDGWRVATASADNTARVWNAATGELITTLQGHAGMLNDLAWSPDGTRIITASDDTEAAIWDATSGALIWTLSHHVAQVFQVDWSADGSRVALANIDGTASIWNPANGSLEHVLTGFSSSPVALRFSPDSRRLAVSSFTGDVKIFNVATGQELRSLVGHTQRVLTLDWSPDGARLATGGFDYSAKIWNTASGTLIQNLVHPVGVISVGWSPDGTRLATGCLDNNARIWNAANGAELRTLSGHSNWIPSLEWSSDGAQLATASFDGTAKVWEPVGGTLVRTLQGHGDALNSVDWSPDATRLATSSDDGTAKVWSLYDMPDLTDVSDALFSIVEPQPASQDIDMGRVIVGSVKDSIVQMYVRNTGNHPFRVDSIQIVNGSSIGFAVVSGIPPFEVPANGSYPVEFRFAPVATGVKTTEVKIYTQGDGMLRQGIRGVAVQAALEVIGDVIDFGQVKVGDQKDTIRAVTIKNVGSAPLDITATHHAGPNDRDFATLAGAGPFTLQPGDTARLDLRYTATEEGRTSGRVLFDYNGTGSPATVQLIGEGVTTGTNPILAIINEDIDFGQVLLGESRDTVRAVTIMNRGTAPLVITGTRHGGANVAEFATLAGAGPFTLLPGDTSRFDLRFTPSAIGPFRGELLFDHGGTGSPAIVQLLGEGVSVAPMLAIINENIDFGKVLVGTSRDTVRAVTIMNRGTAPLVITGTRHGGANAAEFITLAGAGPFTLVPGDTARFDLRFLPPAVGPFRGELLFDHAGPGSPAIVQLLGEGIDVSLATLRPGSASAEPGDVVDIPVRLTHASKVAASGATRFTARLRFNATLLEPIESTPLGIIQGDDRLIDLDLPTEPDPQGILATLRFRAGLGTDSVTTLLLEDPLSVGGTVMMSVEAGEFRLLGICEAGGARLVNPNGVISLKSVHPNPVTGSLANVELETTEIGETRLFMSDMLGRTVRTLIESELVPGRRIYQFDLDDLSTGIYFMTLETPTERRTIRVEVAR